ncbi:MAG: ArgE/DapE family deacylase [Candidatus Tectomicrobia bacterium]|nr:ArgE/DapE family deacylase [Candidatus Tectomicrobia bacterium]
MATMALVEIVKERVEKSAEEIASLTSQLVQFPTFVPPGIIKDCVAFIESYFAKHGIKTAIHKNVDEKPNLCATIPGKGRGKILWLGHLDVVPEGTREAWKYEPYGGKIEGGRVYGRGSTDMKGSCAAAMVTARLLHEIGDDLNPAVEFWFTADEEIGGGDGARWLAEAGKFQGDICVVGDGGCGEDPAIDVGCKGSMGTTLKAIGTTAHGSQPYLGDNALDKLLSVIPYAKKIGEYKLDLPEEIEPAIQSSIDYMLKNLELTEKQAEGVRRIFYYPSVALTILHGGVKSNVIPDVAEATLDIRLTPGTKIEKVRDRMLQIIEESGVQGIVPNIRVGRGGYYESPNSLFYAQFSRTVEMMTGQRPYMRITTGGTDAVSVKHIAGIPCLGFGSGKPAQAHTPDEHVEISSLVRSAKVYAAFPLIYEK